MICFAVKASFCYTPRHDKGDQGETRLSLAGTARGGRRQTEGRRVPASSIAAGLHGGSLSGPPEGIRAERHYPDVAEREVEDVGPIVRGLWLLYTLRFIVPVATLVWPARCVGAAGLSFSSPLAP